MAIHVLNFYIRPDALTTKYNHTKNVDFFYQNKKKVEPCTVWKFSAKWTWYVLAVLHKKVHKTVTRNNETRKKIGCFFSACVLVSSLSHVHFPECILQSVSVKHAFVCSRCHITFLFSRLSRLLLPLVMSVSAIGWNFTVGIIKRFVRGLLVLIIWFLC